MAAGLSALCASAYLFTVGQVYEAGGVLIVALLAAAAVFRSKPGTDVRRTQYREPKWTVRDSIVVGGAVFSMAGVVLALVVSPDAVRYEPYPTLDAPAASLPLIVALLGLLAPALTAGRA
jgi:hypothetical protein